VICKQLKQRCGVGGAVKDLQLEIQGDQRSICKQQLETMGYRVKLSGG
jgi:translation initiation factor 1